MESVQLLYQNSSEELCQSIYKLRYEVLVIEQNKKPEYANHINKWVKEPLDTNGLHFLKMKQGVAIGASRINYLKDITDPFYQKAYDFDFFEKQNLQNHVGVISRMIVHKRYRGSEIFKELVIAMFREILRLSCPIMLVDCIPVFEGLYRKIGFLPYGSSFTHKDGMRVIPMVFDANNKELLAKVNSICYEVYPKDFNVNLIIKEKVLSLVNSTYKLV